mmetsp:Transcript_8746/g.17709  ORF Transcript_8746/g.17709 Transcript_8746/m.17709 type:complete len:248 (-) Transcript_8746:1659-2402(-)
MQERAASALTLTPRSALRRLSAATGTAVGAEITGRKLTKSETMVLTSRGASVTNCQLRSGDKTNVMKLRALNMLPFKVLRNQFVSSPSMRIRRTALGKITFGVTATKWTLTSAEETETPSPQMGLPSTSSCVRRRRTPNAATRLRAKQQGGVTEDLGLPTTTGLMGMSMKRSTTNLSSVSFLQRLSTVGATAMTTFPTASTTPGSMVLSTYGPVTSVFSSELMTKMSAKWRSGAKTATFPAFGRAQS